MIANKYFMRILQLSFLSILVRQLPETSRRDRTESGARRWDRRSLRAAMLGRNVSGKSFVADGRIQERRGRAGEHRETKSAEGAALLVLVGLWRVPFALARGGFHFHLRAAALFFLDFWTERLARDRSERDRRTDHETDEKPQRFLHGQSITRPAGSRFNFDLRREI
jgi:hypothetical protein